MPERGFEENDRSYSLYKSLHVGHGVIGNISSLLLIFSSSVSVVQGLNGVYLSASIISYEFCIIGVCTEPNAVSAPVIGRFGTISLEQRCTSDSYFLICAYLPSMTTSS